MKNYKDMFFELVKLSNCPTIRSEKLNVIYESGKHGRVGDEMGFGYTVITHKLQINRLVYEDSFQVEGIPTQAEESYSESCFFSRLISQIVNSGFDSFIKKI